MDVQGVGAADGCGLGTGVGRAVGEAVGSMHSHGSSSATAAAVWMIKHSCSVNWLSRPILSRS